MILFPSRMCWDLMDSIFVPAAAHPKAWWILRVCCFVDGSQKASGLFRRCFVNFFEGKRCFLLMILSQRSYLCRCNWTVQQRATNPESNIPPPRSSNCVCDLFSLQSYQQSSDIYLCLLHSSLALWSSIIFSRGEGKCLEEAMAADCWGRFRRVWVFILIWT